MSTTEQDTHPYDHARRYPDGEGARHVDWRDALGENMDGWRSAEIVDVEGPDGQTFAMIADMTGRPLSVRVDIDGEPSEWVDADRLEDAAAIQDDGTVAAAAYGAALAALQDAEDHGIDSAAGPMMNSFYLLEQAGYGTRVDIAAWAAELDGLPLCAVELDGDYGLALTGGGMDLGWEIAEAHLRLGYRVPTWISLPAMATGGRLGRYFTSDGDDVTPLDADDAAIVRAVIRDRRAEAARHTHEADTLAQRYGITD